MFILQSRVALAGAVCKPASCCPTRTRRVPRSCSGLFQHRVVSQEKGGSSSSCLSTSGCLPSDVHTLVMTQYRSREEICPLFKLLHPSLQVPTQRAAQDVSSFNHICRPDNRNVSCAKPDFPFLFARINRSQVICGSFSLCNND